MGDFSCARRSQVGASRSMSCSFRRPPCVLLHEVSLERPRQPRREALLAVLASPRTLGWEIAGPLRRHFELASFLSARLPAFREFRVPWGPALQSRARQLAQRTDRRGARG